MEQRNFLQAHIEQTRKALSSIFAEFLGLTSDGDMEHAVAVTNASLKAELGIDVDELIRCDPLRLEAYLAERNLADVPTESLTDYLLALADYTLPTNPERAVNIYQTVLHCYALADASSGSYSLERFTKEQEIQRILLANKQP